MPSGILIIDKPAGWTSMDVCAKVRGIFHEKRVGHGGTLDPMATGVLPVFVGQATRGVEFAENGQKEYVAGLRLGQVTDTQDVTGTTLETRPVTADRAALESLLPRFLGEQDQIPPMYSAVKVGGQKLYDLARKGQVVERKPRRITIYELELLAGLRRDAVRPPPHHGGRLQVGAGSDAGGSPGTGYSAPAAYGQPLRRVPGPASDIRPAGETGPLRQSHPPAGHTGRHLPRIQPGPAVPVPVPGCGRNADVHQEFLWSVNHERTSHCPGLF